MSEHEPITCRSMLDLVPLRWWPEFKRFVEEGEASADFLAFYEQSGPCQRAFEIVLRQDPAMLALMAGLKAFPEVLPEADSAQLPLLQSNLEAGITSLPKTEAK